MKNGFRKNWEEIPKKQKKIDKLKIDFNNDNKFKKELMQVYLK